MKRAEDRAFVEAFGVGTDHDDGAPEQGLREEYAYVVLVQGVRST